MSKLNSICNCQNVHVEREKAEINSQDFLILINQRDLEIDAYAYSNFDLMLCEWYTVPRVLYKRAWPFKSKHNQCTYTFIQVHSATEKSQ